MFDKLIMYIIITFKGIFGGVELVYIHVQVGDMYTCVYLRGQRLTLDIFLNCSSSYYFLESLIEPGVLQLSTLAGQGAPVICLSYPHSAVSGL